MSFCQSWAVQGLKHHQICSLLFCVLLQLSHWLRIWWVFIYCKIPKISPSKRTFEKYKPPGLCSKLYGIFSIVQLQYLSFERQVIILLVKAGASEHNWISYCQRHKLWGGGQGVCSLRKFWNLEPLKWRPETVLSNFYHHSVSFLHKKFCLLFSTKIRSTEKIHGKIVGGNLAHPMIALDLQSLESTFWEANNIIINVSGRHTNWVWIYLVFGSKFKNLYSHLHFIPANKTLYCCKTIKVRTSNIPLVTSSLAWRLCY